MEESAVVERESRNPRRESGLRKTRTRETSAADETPAADSCAAAHGTEVGASAAEVRAAARHPASHASCVHPPSHAAAARATATATPAARKRW